MQALIHSKKLFFKETITDKRSKLRVGVVRWDPIEVTVWDDATGDFFVAPEVEEEVVAKLEGEGAGLGEQPSPRPANAEAQGGVWAAEVVEEPMSSGGSRGGPIPAAVAEAAEKAAVQAERAARAAEMAEKAQVMAQLAVILRDPQPHFLIYPAAEASERNLLH